ncbi:lysophospholipid acyltransferase family protein [Candidatus Riflebacteria bacterium]
MVFYHFIWKATRLFAKLYNNVEIVKEGEPPRKKPLVIIANHTSYYDPVLVGIAIRRPVIFLAKKELYNNTLMRLFLHGMRSKPARRDRKDFDAAKISLKILKDNMTLGLFPEGTRSQDGKFQPNLVKPGFLKIALRTDAFIQVIGISGSFEAFPKGAGLIHPGKIVICFNKPMSAAEAVAMFPGASIKERNSKLCKFYCDEIVRLCKKAACLREKFL